MGTNLYKIRFPSSTRSKRIKNLLDLRKIRRSQVFRSHRLSHFLASDDRIRCQFQAICHHLDLMCGYSDEQKLTALLLILFGQTPHIVDFIRIELATELMQQMNNELHVLITSIYHIVNKIDANYVDEKQQQQQTAGIGVRFERDNLTFRLNVNSISDLMVDLLSLLLENFSNRCRTTNISVTNDILYMFELCYQRYSHNQALIERNLQIIHTLTQGCGRFERTKAIVEYEPLMQRLMNHHLNDGYESLLVLKIVNSMTNGFAENIERLEQCKLLNNLKKHLTNVIQSPYAVIEQCLYILENICGNHRSDIQAVIDAQLIAPLINVFKSTDSDVNLRKIACNIFLSISSLGSIDQIKILLQHDLLRLLCLQLHFQANFNEDIVETILEVMNNIVRDFYRRDHQAYHQIIAMIVECGGFMAIDQLIAFTNEAISSVALQLNQYTGSKCARCNQRPLNATIEQMQQ